MVINQKLPPLTSPAMEFEDTPLTSVNSMFNQPESSVKLISHVALFPEYFKLFSFFRHFHHFYSLFSTVKSLFQIQLSQTFQTIYTFFTCHVLSNVSPDFSTFVVAD